nr:helix-turn-helix transcriptional regulator [uncultured Catonella sp.]
MITIIIYDKLWETMKTKGFSQYRLINYYGISHSQIHRLKMNEYVTTATLCILCQILNCNIEDIVSYVPNGK